jgi:hypothetical protein
MNANIQLHWYTDAEGKARSEWVPVSEIQQTLDIETEYSDEHVAAQLEVPVRYVRAMHEWEDAPEYFERWESYRAAIAAGYYTDQCEVTQSLSEMQA